MLSTSLRHIVVSGATGKQGGALIDSLLSHPTPVFEIYALTRNAASKAALSLSAKSHVKVIQGDFSNPSAIFAQVPKPWGFFSVTNPMNAAREEAQGKAMTTAAIEAGVCHIVFTATDRGTNSGGSATPVPHFASKYEIERNIIEQSNKNGRTYTFIRPVAFYENLTNDFFGKGFISMWRLNGDDSKIQFVSTKDIGKVAAEAFLESDTEQYKNNAVHLAGDELSLGDFERIFKEETKRQLPETFGVVAKALKWTLHEQLGIMFDWLKNDGFTVDVDESRKTYPFLKDFRQWLSTESAWRRV